MMQCDTTVFERVRTLDEAKRIILSNEMTLTTENRWRIETPHICDLIGQNFSITSNSVILDYGCGVGRLAKELINRYDCLVIGTDISANMLALAVSYVNSPHFVTCHPAALNMFWGKCDFAISVWVLQHVSVIDSALDDIERMLITGGGLFIVNEGKTRFVPTAKGWATDGVDVRAKLNARFGSHVDGKLDPKFVGDQQSNRTFWATYHKR